MKSLFSVFQKGFQKTATSISRTISSIFSGSKAWDDATFKSLEDALVAADFGIVCSRKIVSGIRDRYERGLIQTDADIVQIARADILEILKANVRPMNFAEGRLNILMLVGVNGSGKTTTAGKLAYQWIRDGRKVMLAACDTFRAAAVQQLNLWGERTGAYVVSSKQGADPASVAYDAIQSALSRKADILIIDTAGRQHTRKGLMDELAKMRRIIDKLYPDAPLEVWLTIDSGTGTNAAVQAREFSGCTGVTGLVLTKLDGTGRGGTIVPIQSEFKLPVFFIGLGEQPDDLQPFDSDYYLDAIFAKN